MRARRRVFFALATWATWCLLWKHGAEAASILPEQNPPEPSPQALGICKHSGQESYFHEGLCCKKCPPGFQVENHCTPTSETTCRPCDNDTYSRHHNALQRCFSCTICRKFDQVETQQCTPTSDTQCSCVNGTFCSPDHPCETCQKCRLRCPAGEAMMQPCTPTSDLQCHPTTTPSPAPTGFNLLHLVWIIPSVLVMGLVVVGLILVLKFRRLCCWRAAGAKDSPVTWSPCKVFFEKNVPCFRGSRRQGPQERRDNEQNEWIDETLLPPPPSSNPSGSGAPGRMAPHGSAPNEERCEDRDLIPANGKDPTEALRQSFETFIGNVPVQDWRRYMRALDLTENEILRAERDERNVYEQQFRMLQTCLDKGGRQVTLKALLDTLCLLDLRGVAREVREALVSRGLYVYRE